jgi:hypothetical protein
MKKWLVLSLSVIVIVLSLSSELLAAGNQVFFRGGYAALNNDRGDEVFTDTLGETADILGTRSVNDGRDGWYGGAGLNLALINDLGPGTLLGEIMVEYAQFSREEVLKTSTALLNIIEKKKIPVSELAVRIGPKYRLELANGKIRPWIIPVGIAFLVNSPPSDDVTYLDIGAHVGVGLDIVVAGPFSFGIDGRYTFGANQSDTNTSYGTVGGYIGINF